MTLGQIQWKVAAINGLVENFLLIYVFFSNEAKVFLPNVLKNVLVFVVIYFLLHVLPFLVLALCSVVKINVRTCGAVTSHLT